MSRFILNLTSFQHYYCEKEKSLGPTIQQFSLQLDLWESKRYYVFLLKHTSFNRNQLKVINVSLTPSTCFANKSAAQLSSLGIHLKQTDSKALEISKMSVTTPYNSGTELSLRTMLMMIFESDSTLSFMMPKSLQVWIASLIARLSAISGEETLFYILEQVVVLAFRDIIHLRPARDADTLQAASVLRIESTALIGGGKPVLCVFGFFTCSCCYSLAISIPFDRNSYLKIPVRSWLSINST